MGTSAKLRHLYPANWPEISRWARERAGWRCERCHAREGALGGHRADGRWCEALPLDCAGRRPERGEEGWCEGSAEKLRIVQIRLAACHLNHDPSDNRPDNIQVLCQRHHLAHDRAHHVAGARRTRDQRRGQGALPL